MEIKGTTRLVGVFGWPVHHTLSPRMHNAAFAALGLDWAYLPLSVPPERVGDAVRGLPALGFAGANVTVPHKQAILPFVDELTPIARAVGAANTLVVRPDGSILGDNTDGAGFLADLAAHDIRPRSALLLGSGGAARAVAFALAETGAHVMVAARSAERGAALCQSVSAALAGDRDKLSVHPFPDALPSLATEADLIVNATSLGLHEGDVLPWHPDVPLAAGQVVYDLIYNRPTPLLALAEAAGARAIGGLGMLIHQGARAFELWTGMAAPVEVMAAALRH